MKIVRVTYTTKPQYAEQNSRNIKAVMNDLQLGKHSGIFYHVTLNADGRTFTHSAFFQSGEDEQLLNALESFRHFQQQLKAEGLEVPPRQELLTLVGSSGNIFERQYHSNEK